MKENGQIASLLGNNSILLKSTGWMFEMYIKISYVVQC